MERKKADLRAAAIVQAKVLPQEKPASQRSTTEEPHLAQSAEALAEANNSGSTFGADNKERREPTEDRTIRHGRQPITGS